MSARCPSCCLECAQTAPKPQPSTSASPYAAHNLLKAGTVSLQLAADVHLAICDHSHAEDGWHNFRAPLILPHLSEAGELSFCRELDFLVKQRFAAVTYRISGDGQMIFRIYLIPYDLSNVQGALRIRKENILNPAKRYLRNLLPRISQNLHRWDGHEILGEEREFLSSIQDSRTLADIYSDLRSPSVSPVQGLGAISSRLLDFGDDLQGLGMRSTLFKYQRRSVAAMLQNELDAKDVPDPLFISVQTLDGVEFYLQPGTMEILQQRPMTVPCRGGILCEELGTGKTVMMLSLITATRHQISTPEPSIVDERPIMTPLAFRHFPSDDFASARKRFFSGRDPYEKLSSNNRVPSLVELLLHHHRVSPHCDIPRIITTRGYERSIRIEDEVHTLPLGAILRSNTPFYHHYLGEPSNRERTKRKQRQLGPRVMYLTSATLVVVPPNLLSQWDREIAKHCAVPLRVFILRAKTPMPSARSLATDYDIILTTYNRFAAESNLQDVSKLHTWTVCQCPEPAGYRVPECACETTGVSPFLQIRWKRLIIDEGHVSSSTSTILVPFAKLLSVERRWIVTGTPTTNLLGLSLGTKAIEPTKSPFTTGYDTDSQRTDEVASLSADFDDPMEDSQTASMISVEDVSPSTSPPPSSPPSQRIWNRYDRDDLLKLGNMITHFIAVPQFSADSKLMSTHVTEPLLDPSGPRRGSIRVLNQLMEMVMIRHRIEDVEEDVILPPVTQEYVLLDLDPYVIKSFNALQAIIAINAIDSRRTDQDYMFNARNAPFLQRTVKNMSQLFFWHVDDGLYNAVQLLQLEDEMVEKAVKDNCSSEDKVLLKEAFDHLRIALEDPIWRSMQSHEDVPYRVSNMADIVYNAWTRTPGKEPSSSANQTGFLHADRLLKLYDMILQKPLIRENAMVEWGQAVATRDQVFRKAYEESLHRKGKGGKLSRNGNDNDRSSTSSGSLMADNFAKKASAAETLKEMQKELDATMAKLARDEDGDNDEENGGEDLPSSFSGPAPRRLSNLVASSPLAKMRVGSSASTKLNYIIDEVQRHAPTEKILIFSESPLTMAHVAEALELIHVKFLRFTTQVTPQFREQLVLTFETSETYRVFLMELKHGARGLNLISASRVIFCEPVWQADVESQAIKRAHRIGQTRPITVKTLAVRDTVEENMVLRSAALRSSQEKLPKLIEEAGMRHYIANPHFITRSPAPSRIIDFPFIDLPGIAGPQSNSVILKIPAPSMAQSSSTLKRVWVEDPVITPSPLNSEQEPPVKRKKGLSIRFATP